MSRASASELMYSRMSALTPASLLILYETQSGASEKILRMSDSSRLVTKILIHGTARDKARIVADPIPNKIQNGSSRAAGQGDTPGWAAAFAGSTGLGHLACRKSKTAESRDLDPPSSRRCSPRGSFPNPRSRIARTRWDAMCRRRRSSPRHADGGRCVCRRGSRRPDESGHFCTGANWCQGSIIVCPTLRKVSSAYIQQAIHRHMLTDPSTAAKISSCTLRSNDSFARINCF